MPHRTLVLKSSLCLLAISFFSIINRCSGDKEVVYHPDTTGTIECTVAAYYYPWYSNRFHNRHYMRRQLSPQQLPFLGEYNDRNSVTLQTHFDWCRYAGISVLVTSWWGPDDVTDVTTLEYMLPHPGLQNIKIALFYETTRRVLGENYTANIRSDFTYMANNYFSHPNYYKINNKPVVFVYLSRTLDVEGILDSCVSLMRTTARSKGYDVYVIGDHAYASPDNRPAHFRKMDAITNYDVYGSMGNVGYAGMAGVRRYGTTQFQWSTLAKESRTGFVPCVSPGFNDRAVRSGHSPTSRQLVKGGAEGTLFRELIKWTKGLSDPDLGNLFIINSWNEWHEDTQIEPVKKADPTDKDISASGTDYTDGLYYHGYDSLYLKILREEFVTP